MYSTPSQMKTSLDAYRAHVAARTRRILEVYVRVLASADEEACDVEDDEDIDQLRMDSLRCLLGASEDLFREFRIAEPADVLERYEQIAPLLGLDGVQARRAADTPDEEAEKARQWEEYFSVLEAELRAKSLEEVRTTITVPEELRVLAGFVDAVDYQGLDRNEIEGTFWRGLRDWGCGGAVGRRMLAERVKGPEDIGWMSGRDCRREVAGGWKIGEAAEQGFFCAVYCRMVVEEGEEEDKWAWRYSFHSMYDFSTWMFDTIPEMLEWYRDFDDEIPAEEDLDARELLMAMF